MRRRIAQGRPILLSYLAPSRTRRNSHGSRLPLGHYTISLEATSTDCPSEAVLCNLWINEAAKYVSI
jgi:hypothetical protein